MKSILIILTAIFTVGAFAQDMSRTENYKDSYRELEDGSNEYIGGCSLHQDYEGVYFDVTKTIVKQFEPSRENPVESQASMKKLANVEKELLIAAANGEDLIVFYSNVDDIGLDKISSRTFKKLDLYRFNIGVGGGNGYYAVFSREIIKGTIVYNQLSNVFDGDVEFCDKSVWLKK